MIAIKENNTGDIYTNDMSLNNKFVITKMHFCTSYTQVSVQRCEDGKFPKKDIFIKPLNNEMNVFNDLAFDGTESWGEFITIDRTNNLGGQYGR